MTTETVGLAAIFSQTLTIASLCSQLPSVAVSHQNENICARRSLLCGRPRILCLAQKTTLKVEHLQAKYNIICFDLEFG